MDDWRLEGFTEIGELGTGAQGRVVLARRGGRGPYVAIKYVRAGAGRVPSQREARILARVDDPHIARLYELVEGAGGVALVMEAVPGHPLAAVLARNGALPPEAALLVLRGSLLGLAAAHAAGVVHRDYKPSNVIVQADGASKLIDFGVATAAGTRSRAGTPAYMAPEQWGGEPASSATDVYAATCVFYECVTGRPPFAGDGPLALMAQHSADPVPLEDVPAPLRRLVEQGMAKDPGHRPRGAAEFVAVLEAVAGEAYGSGWERRGRLALAALAVALLRERAAAPSGSVSLAETVLARTALRPDRGRRVRRALTAALAAAAVLVIAVALVLARDGHRAGSAASTWATTPATGHRPLTGRGGSSGGTAAGSASGTAAPTGPRAPSAPAPAPSGTSGTTPTDGATPAPDPSTAPSGTPRTATTRPAPGPKTSQPRRGPDEPAPKTSLPRPGPDEPGPGTDEPRPGHEEPVVVTPSRQGPAVPAQPIIPDAAPGSGAVNPRAGVPGNSGEPG
ncbi:protein kinase domain-containing protein [Actinomadura nitritigenes]|uniref:serine/threonine-protein kinase n=1 Tax=Actinomadura nitritigenes TaxID=134602 RepID=UPI003D8EFCED